MSLIIPVLLISFVALAYGLPAFEFTFAVLLSAPILAYLAGMLGLHLAWPVYLGSVLAAIAFFIYICRGDLKHPAQPRLFDRELVPIALFCITFLASFGMCMLWPDFVAIGERLRDYSLLASAINFPLEAREPWMAGSTLNYYLYWYRFGVFLAECLRMPVWDTYHTLSAFSIALYLTASFRVMNRYLSMNVAPALLGAIVIAFGSNVSGIHDFLTGDTNWWGPSRVVKGAIDEFPAWSFVLGDIHPHYLNLGLMPLFACLALATFPAAVQNRLLSFWIGTIAVVLPLWVYNANAWEIPAVAAVAGAGFMCGALLLLSGSIASNQRNILSRAVSLVPLTSLRAIISAAVFLLFSVSLYNSCQNIARADYKWDLVVAPILRTTTSETLLHWGLPLILIAISQIALFSHWAARIGVTVLIGLTLLYPESWPFVGVLAAIVFARSVSSMTRTKSPDGQASSSEVLLHALGLAGFALILVTEITFLNDPYGGENERMNTIFKFYSAAWFMLHTYAFVMLARLFKDRSWILAKFAPPAFLYALVIIFMTGFFVHTAKLRKNEVLNLQPRSRGLSSINKLFPGAANAIRSLERAPRGPVLEAQGNPYSYTSHVSTLSGQESYLGWANHVELLTKQYEEVERRRNMTNAIYSETDCNKRSELMRQEGIRYLVAGPLEREKYPGLGQLDFSCMAVVAQGGRYRVFMAMQ